MATVRKKRALVEAGDPSGGLGRRREAPKQRDVELNRGGSKYGDGEIDLGELAQISTNWLGEKNSEP